VKTLNDQPISKVGLEILSTSRKDDHERHANRQLRGFITLFHLNLSIPLWPVGWHSLGGTACAALL